MHGVRWAVLALAVSLVAGAGAAGQPPADREDLRDRARRAVEQIAQVEKARAEAARAEAERVRAKALFEQATVARAELEEATARADHARGALARAEEGLRRLLNAGAAMDEARRLRDELDRERRRADEAQALARLAREEASRRNTEAKGLRKAHEDMLKDYERLLAQLKDATDRLVQGQIAERAARERAAQLTEQVARLTRELALLRAKGGAEPVKAPPDVEGRVLRVAAETGLLTVNLGSDAGLARGQRLEVFRLGPAPRYLGQVEVKDVSAREAVCQVLGRARAPIQAGDSVASRIR